MVTSEVLAITEADVDTVGFPPVVEDGAVVMVEAVQTIRVGTIRVTIQLLRQKT